MSIFSRILPFGGGGSAPKKSTAVIRSDLAHDPALDAAQTLTAFSPDIVPLGTATPEREDIAAAYNAFVAQPLYQGEKNGVWIRARSFSSSAAASTPISLVQLENELILWPQTWLGVPAVGKAVLKPATGGPSNLLISDGPIPVQGTAHGIGRHSTLIALCDEGTTRDGLLASNNWRDFVESMGAHPALTALNVLTVTPVDEHFVLRTRLRVFENEHEHAELRLSLEAVGIPRTGLEARLVVYSNTGEELYTIERTPLVPASNTTGVDVRLPQDFDGMVHVEIFKAPWAMVCNFASISLVATAVNRKGVTTLLGAEHIVFDTAITLKRYLDARQKLWADTGFWFRGSLDEGPPPRRQAYGRSPDIQPAGMRPDPNATQTYSNFKTDIASANGVQLYPNAANFIYARATTSRAISAEARLYAVPSGVLQQPSKYFKFSVRDSYMVDPQTFHDDAAIRGFSSKGAEGVVIPLPFNHFKPAPPNTMSPGSDHFCLVIEAREKIDPNNPQALTQWPHQDLLATTDQLAAWLLNEPRVAYRNTTYASGANTDVISMQTSLTMPDTSTPTEEWTYYVDVKNAPVGSEVEVVGLFIGTGAVVPNDDLSIPPTRITRSTSQRIYSQPITGVKAGFNAVLTLYWRAKGQAKPNNLVLDVGIHYTGGALGLLAQTQRAHWELVAADVKKDLVVFPDYPLFKAEVKGIRANHAQGYTGIRGAMRAYDAPGKVAASVAQSQAPPTRVFVLGTDTLIYNK